MKVVSPADFSHITPLGRPVEKGEEVDVPDDLGEQLLAQGWKPAYRKGGHISKAKAKAAGLVVGEQPENVIPASMVTQTEEQ